MPEATRPGRGSASANLLLRHAQQPQLQQFPDLEHRDLAKRRMKLIAFIAEPTVAKRILDHLGVDSTGPPLTAPRVVPPDSVDPAPAYDVADPVYEG
jgi:hypothetical protein